MSDEWREAGSRVVSDRHDLVPIFVIEGRPEKGRVVRHDASEHTDFAVGQLDIWRKREPDKEWRLLAVTRRFQVIENYREYVEEPGKYMCEHGTPYAYRCDQGCDD